MEHREEELLAAALSRPSHRPWPETKRQASLEFVVSPLECYPGHRQLFFLCIISEGEERTCKGLNIGSDKEVDFYIHFFN